MKVSKKRQAETRHYQRIKKELEQELKRDGKWFCFFSGVPFPDHVTWKDVTWHHLKGRDGELFIDKKFLVPVYDKYHTGDEGWHNRPLSVLKSYWWFDVFLERLKEKDYSYYQKIWYKLNEL